MNSTHQEQPKKNILVVEDDIVLNQFLQKNLENSGYTTTTLSEGEAIPGVIERNQISLVILDIELPGKNGYYWLEWFKNYHPFIPIIVVSARAKPQDRVKGLEAGAHDYLTKPFMQQELLIKIAALFAIDSKQSKQALLTSGDFSIDTINNRVKIAHRNISLIKQECKILQLFFMNESIPLSRDELCLQTIGSAHTPGSRTIDIHINRLRIKIEDNPSDPTYIRTIRGKGYCFYLPDTDQLKA